jgi:hypothetical protein
MITEGRMIMFGFVLIKLLEARPDSALMLPSEGDERWIDRVELQR